MDLCKICGSVLVEDKDEDIIYKNIFLCSKDNCKYSIVRSKDLSYTIYEFFNKDGYYIENYYFLNSKYNRIDISESDYELIISVDGSCADLSKLQKMSMNEFIDQLKLYKLFS